MDLSTLQRSHAVWLHHNFPDQQPFQPLLGMAEELGEISHAYLKHSQGIRNIDEQRSVSLIEDGLGDLLIYMCSFATSMGIDIDEAVTRAWTHVQQRDWQAFPATGVPPVSTGPTE